MTTKELIHAEIDRLSEDDLEKLYELIIGIVQIGPPPKQQGKSILAKLREIQFDGPEDLAANHDLYLSGEKREE